MRCPVDNETLVMTERSGVEIDYCPKCRGVWLDRGELDKIIERGMSASGTIATPVAPQQAVPPVAHHQPPQSAPYPSAPQAPYPGSHDPRYYDPKKAYKRDDDDYYRYKKKRKESFLGELFDFD